MCVGGRACVNISGRSTQVTSMWEQRKSERERTRGGRAMGMGNAAHESESNPSKNTHFLALKDGSHYLFVFCLVCVCPPSMDDGTTHLGDLLLSDSPQSAY